MDTPNPVVDADTILVVDDNAYNLKFLLAALENEGFFVLTAENGHSALERVKYILPDLILLDVIMPDIDGFEVARQLKNSPRSADIPIIFLTALSDDHNLVKGFEVGGVDYIAKPLSIRETLARINTHLTLRKLHRQLESQNVQLEQEVRERLKAELALQQLNEALEHRVSERTLELQTEIVERKRAEAELRQRHHELTTLNSVTSVIGQSHDVNYILQTALSKSLELAFTESPTSSFHAGCIYLVDEESESLRLVAQQGFSSGTQETLKSLGQTQAASMINVAAEDLTQVKSHPCLAATSQAGWHLLTSMPLKFEDIVFGVMNIFARAPGSSNALPEDVAAAQANQHLLQSIARQVALALENDRLQKETTRAQVAVEVNHLQSGLIDNVSHELRTPLGLIKATITTLLAEDIEFDEETWQMLLISIHEETNKLESLVNNLLDLSRMSKKGVTLNRQLTSIDGLVNKVIKSAQLTAPDAPIENRLAAHFPEISVDAKLIEQVLHNLVSNAIKYSPGGGKITIEGEAEPDFVHLSVSDEGIGLAAEDLNRIFERFYRVENNVTLGVRGVGLGLPICREIVQAHGGRIWAASNGSDTSNSNSGSVFHFTLQRIIQSETETEL